VARDGPQGKQFFFEKKNQKTFATMHRSLIRAPEPDSVLKWKKFFGSFFQKELLSLSCLAVQFQNGLV